MKNIFLKRALLVLLSMLLCTGLLCACNGGSGDTETPTTTTSEAVTRPPVNPKPEAIGYKKVHIVRNADGNADYKKLCDTVKSYFEDTLGLEAKLVSDFSYKYAPEEGLLELFLGNPLEIEITERARAKATDTSAVFLYESDQLAIYAKTNQMLWLAVQQFLEDATEKGNFIIPKNYKELKLDLSASLRENWKQPFPAYEGGVLDATLYSAGGGLFETEETNISWLQLVEQTTESEYLAYVEKLEALGYDVTFNNYIDGNYYTNLYDHLGNNIYVYYLCEMGAEKGNVRAIIDNSSVSLEEFSYTMDASDKSTFYFFNHNNKSENLYLIHSADNKWIVFDGGTDDKDGKFARSLYEFMEEKSNLAEGEKVVISCWYISHTDGDHYQGFKRMVEDYHQKIVIERLLGNVPDFERTATHNSHRTGYRSLLKTITTYFPDVMYLKAHSGMKIQLADVEFTVLITQEEVVDYWVKNRGIFSSTWVNWWNYWTDAEGYPQDGRGSKTDLEYCLGYKKYDYNNSSMITKIDLAGMTILAMGDAFRADQWMLPYYDVKTLNSEVILAAHHFFNTELHPFYKECAALGEQLFFLVPCMDYETNHSTNLDYASGQYFSKVKVYQSLKAEKNQRYITAATDTIYGIREVNGVVTLVEEVPAKFSFIGNLDRYK